MKRCSKCGIEKPRCDFYKNKNSPDGFRPDCRVCLNKAQREYYVRNRDEVRARSLAYYLNNNEKAVKARKVYYAANKPAAIRAARNWSKRNSMAVLVCTQNRRAKKRMAGGTHTVSEVRDLLLQQNFRCANFYCQADLTVVKKHLDHIMPIALRGSNGIDNLQWLCATCNYFKNDLSPLAWISKLATHHADS